MLLQNLVRHKDFATQQAGFCVYPLTIKLCNFMSYHYMRGALTTFRRYCVSRYSFCSRTVLNRSHLSLLCPPKWRKWPRNSRQNGIAPSWPTRSKTSISEKKSYPTFQLDAQLPRFRRLPDGHVHDEKTSWFEQLDVHCRLTSGRGTDKLATTVSPGPSMRGAKLLSRFFRGQFGQCQHIICWLS